MASWAPGLMCSWHQMMSWMWSRRPLDHWIFSGKFHWTNMENPWKIHGRLLCLSSFFGETMWLNMLKCCVKPNQWWWTPPSAWDAWDPFLLPISLLWSQTAYWVALKITAEHRWDFNERTTELQSKPRQIPLIQLFRLGVFQWFYHNNITICSTICNKCVNYILPFLWF